MRSQYGNDEGKQSGLESTDVGAAVAQLEQGRPQWLLCASGSSLWR